MNGARFGGSEVCALGEGDKQQMELVQLIILNITRKKNAIFSNGINSVHMEYTTENKYSLYLANIRS